MTPSGWHDVDVDVDIHDDQADDDRADSLHDIAIELAAEQDHPYRPGGYVQTALFDGDEFEGCAKCGRHPDDEVHR